MIPELRLFLCDDEAQRFFGNGPYRLLCRVSESGSLRVAAVEMGMSYSKAHAIIRRAEDALGYRLTSRVIGGKGGGGSSLTPEAENLLRCYECYHEACAEFARASFDRFFTGIFSSDAEQPPVL